MKKLFCCTFSNYAEQDDIEILFMSQLTRSGFIHEQRYVQLTCIVERKHKKLGSGYAILQQLGLSNLSTDAAYPQHH